MKKKNRVLTCCDTLKRKITLILSVCECVCIKKIVAKKNQKQVTVHIKEIKKRKNRMLLLLLLFS